MACKDGESEIDKWDGPGKMCCPHERVYYRNMENVELDCCPEGHKPYWSYPQSQDCCSGTITPKYKSGPAPDMVEESLEKCEQDPS